MRKPPLVPASPSLAPASSRLLPTTPSPPPSRVASLRLYFGEWQERSQRLGERLYSTYFPEASSSSGGASSAGASSSANDGLSEYERQRNKVGSCSRV